MEIKLTRKLIAQRLKHDYIEKIKNLNFYGSNIQDISIIEEMISLEIVSLSVNKIKTLKPFENLQNLKKLYLRNNLISNLNEVQYLTNCNFLEILWLKENPICDEPNYRPFVICILPQIQNLDEIEITVEERDKALKKLSGNLEEEDKQEKKQPVLEKRERFIIPKKSVFNRIQNSHSAVKIKYNNDKFSENKKKDIINKRNKNKYGENNEFKTKIRQNNFFSCNNKNININTNRRYINEGNNILCCSKDEEIKNLREELNKKVKLVEEQKIKIINLENEINKANNNITEIIRTFKEEINDKNIELNNLKQYLESIKIKKKEIIYEGDMATVYFTSTDQRINFAVPCVKNNTFAEVEEKLYKEYPEYRETNNIFLANGKQVLRFKTIEENNIGNGKPVVFKSGIIDENTIIL